MIKPCLRASELIIFEPFIMNDNNRFKCHLCIQSERRDFFYYYYYNLMFIAMANVLLHLVIDKQIFRLHLIPFHWKSELLNIRKRCNGVSHSNKTSRFINRISFSTFRHEEVSSKKEREKKLDSNQNRN